MPTRQFFEQPAGNEMKRHAIALALAGFLLSPAARADVELMGKALQVYGKLHVSYDLYDRGGSTVDVPDPSDSEVVSNSSRLGFKGEVDLGATTKALWKFESEIDVVGEVGELKARSRYLGVGGGWGHVLVGIEDTPLKRLAGSYTEFGDTIADRRGILGQVSSGAHLFNVRAKNMVTYGYRGKGFAFDLMAANDFEDVTDPDQSDNQLFGVGLSYKASNWGAGIAWESQSDMGGVDGADADAIRFGGNYSFGRFKVGGLYEMLSDDGWGNRVERDAFAINASMQIAPDWKIAIQYMEADSSDAGNDGADEIAIGAYYKITKAVEVYAMYAELSNDSNASYRLARSGHGQAYQPTAAGEKVNAFSVGMSLSF